MFVLFYWCEAVSPDGKNEKAMFKHICYLIRAATCLQLACNRLGYDDFLKRMQRASYLSIQIAKKQFITSIWCKIDRKKHHIMNFPDPPPSLAATYPSSPPPPPKKMYLKK